MKSKSRVKKLILAIFLATAGIFGMSSALINKQVEESNIAEAADSSGFTGGEVFYIVDKTSKFGSSAHCRLYLWGSGGNILSEVYPFSFKYEETSGNNYDTYAVKIPTYPYNDGGSWTNFMLLRYKTDHDSDTVVYWDNRWNQSFDCVSSFYKDYTTWWANDYSGVDNPKKFSVGYSNTFGDTTSGDTALLFGINEDSGYYSGCKIALHYGGYGVSRTVDTEIIGGYLRANTIPAGVAAFQLLRVDPSLSLPIDGYPTSGVYHDNQFIYNSSKNMVTMKAWSGSEYASEYGTTDKTMVPKGTRYIFKNDGGLVSDWFAGGAYPYFVSWPSSTNYFGGYTQWLMTTRIGTSQFMEVTTDRTLCMANYAYARNNPSSGAGWGNTWNQTEDISINRSGGLVCGNGSSNNKVNVKAAADEDYADLWGAVFMANVTCSGSGSITGANWSKTETEYLGLTATQQYIIFTETGVISDSTYRAMGIYRYDYIIHKYGTGTYNDYINRIGGKGSGNKYPYNSIQSFSPFSLFNGEDDISTIIIIAASSIALISIASLSILIIKKRRSKEEE